MGAHRIKKNKTEPFEKLPMRVRYRRFNTTTREENKLLKKEGYFKGEE